MQQKYRLQEYLPRVHWLRRIQVCWVQYINNSNYVVVTLALCAHDFSLHNIKVQDKFYLFLSNHNICIAGYVNVQNAPYPMLCVYIKAIYFHGSMNSMTLDWLRNHLTLWLQFRIDCETWKSDEKLLLYIKYNGSFSYEWFRLELKKGFNLHLITDSYFIFQY